MANWRDVQENRLAAEEEKGKEKKEFNKKKKAFLKKYPFSQDPKIQEKNYDALVTFLLELEQRLDKTGKAVGSVRHRHIRK